MSSMARAVGLHVWLLAAVVLAAAPLHAQGIDSTAASPLPDSVLGLHPGVTLHVAAPSVGQLEARLVRATGRELVLRADSGERTVRLEAGDSLWVLGHSARQGAKIGATTGVAITVTLFALFQLRCQSGTDDPCTGQLGFIPFGLVTTGAFALTGAAAGRFVPRWELRWP